MKKDYYSPSVQCVQYNAMTILMGSKDGGGSTDPTGEPGPGTPFYQVAGRKLYV